MEKDRKEGSSYVQYTQLASVGMQLVVSTLVGYGIGRWLDGKLGTGPALMITFVLLGAAAGFLNIYKTATKGG